MTRIYQSEVNKTVGGKAGQLLEGQCVGGRPYINVDRYYQVDVTVNKYNDVSKNTYTFSVDLELTILNENTQKDVFYVEIQSQF